MRILISGSSGLVGTALSAELEKDGYAVVRLKRSGTPSADSPVWDPSRGIIDAGQLEGIDAVYNLAGENIASGPWTHARRERILSSRTQTTALLTKAVCSLKRPPRFFFCASAIGYYGSQGDSWVTEDSPKGSGFLADVCQAWENASAAARECGIRLVNGRISLVLSSRGGALPKMLLPFRLGLGGRVGSGTQQMSWISLSDLVRALVHCLEQEQLSGPVNLATPNPVSNSDFTRSLAAALHRPAFFPVPAPLLTAVLGDMARETLLASIRVKPQKLSASGFSFSEPDLDQALDRILTKRL